MVTNYFANVIMGNVFATKTSPATPTDYYLGLSTGTPTVSGTGVVEPTQSKGYQRIALMDLSQPTNGLITNTEELSFPESTASWGTITHFVIYDAQTGGNLLMFDALSTARVIEAETVLLVRNNSLRLSLTNPV